MPMAAVTTTTTALGPSLLRCHQTNSSPTPPSIVPVPPTIRVAKPRVARRILSCQVAVTTDVSSSSASAGADEEPEGASKVGERIRVKVPLKVYHVPKNPEVDLNGMEGKIKQYVGLWKGKRISANLPFKVEFSIPVEGQDKPVKFVAHLKDDEFDYVSD